jgi:hypothetical protein
VEFGEKYYLRSIEKENQNRQNKKLKHRHNLKINTLEGRLTNKRTV